MSIYIHIYLSTPSHSVRPSATRPRHGAARGARGGGLRAQKRCGGFNILLLGFRGLGLIRISVFLGGAYNTDPTTVLRLLYGGPLFSETPIWSGGFRGPDLSGTLGLKSETLTPETTNPRLPSFRRPSVWGSKLV